MELEAYLCFYGRCEEALNFYKDVFRGEITSLNRVEGSPTESHVPQKTRNESCTRISRDPAFSSWHPMDAQTSP